MQHEPLNPELAALETALGGLSPRPAGLDRDRLMYLAGQTAGVRAARRRPGAWLWPCATAASLALAAVLGLRGPAVTEPTVERAVAEQKSVEPALPEPGVDWRQPGQPNSYLLLRELVLRHGVEAMPEPRKLGGPTGDLPRARSFDRRSWSALLADPST